MTAYLIVFFFMAVLFWYKSFQKTPSVLFWLCMITISSIAGLRDVIGGFDVYIYGEVFEAISTEMLLLYPSFEIGFKLYNLLLRQIYMRREFLFFVSSFVFLAYQSAKIRRFSKGGFLDVFVYMCKFYFLSFVYVRQGIAMAIAIFAVEYLLVNKRKTYFVLILLTVFFHKSAVFLLPLAFVANWRFSQFQLILLTFAVLIVGISPLGQLVFELLGSTTGNEKLERYAGKSSTVNFLYLIEVLMLVVFAVVFKKDFYKEEKSTVIFNGFLIYIYLIIISLTNATFIRLGWYYYVFMVLALGNIYVYMKNPTDRFIYRTFIFIYFSATFFKTMLTLTAGDLLPYKAIFQNFERNGASEAQYEYRHRYNIE